MSSDKDGGKTPPTGPPAGYEDIFVRSFFHKGLQRRVYASEYGKTCFVLRVRIGRRKSPAKRAA